MSQHRYISQELLQDSCLRCRCYSILIIRFCGPAQAKRKFWAPETPFVWPCAGKTTAEMHFLWPCAGETQILNCRDAFFVALRRRNANFDLRRRIFCPDEVDSRGVRAGWPKSPRRYSETQKKNSARRFAQAKRKFWPPESRFLWPCAVKNEQTENLHLDLRGFTLTVRTPQCDTLFGEWRHSESWCKSTIST